MNPKRLLGFLRSARLALALIIALAVVSVPGALRTSPAGTFRSPLFVGLAALLTANILFCTAQRYGVRGRDRRLRLTDALLHLSLVFVIAGGAVKSLRGFVGTQNVHVGTETRSVYDWRTGSDAPLGFALRVQRLLTEYHPFRARIGLSDPRSGKRIGVAEVTEGQPGVATAAGVSISLRDVDREGLRAGFAVRTRSAEGVVTLGLVPGPAASAEVGEVRLTLIAYRDEERMVSVLVNTLSESGLVVERWLSPNGSLAVGGMQIFLTAWGRDEFGNEFAGLQVSRDPGAPLFWVGCIVFVCALPLHLIVKLRRRAAS